MKKAKLTRSLMAAVSIVALSAVMYGCVHSGDGDTTTTMETPDPDPDPALGAAQTAADEAADAAETAAGNAESAAAGVMANADADEGSYALASNAATRARAAASAARAASDAAAAATDTAAAQAQQAIAVAKQKEAVAEQTNAVKYAGMVTAAHVEAMNLATAMTAADTAAGLAEAAAAAAEAAATKVAELAGEGSDQAMAANAAAEAARTAARNARSASDSAQAATMSGDAQTHRATAVTEQGTAETQRDAALELRRVAQVAADVGGVLNEGRDLEDAQEATAEAATEVNTHYIAAKGKAEMAAAQASAARAAAIRAKSARRDYANADKYAKLAEAANATAQAAMRSAMQANADAQAANTAAMNAETSDEAEAQQDIAEAALKTSTEAHTGTTGAGMAYMAAKDASAKAVEASGDNVLGFLMLLNGDDTGTDAALMARLDDVNELLSGDAQADAATPGLGGGARTSSDTVAATVTWRYHGDLGTSNVPGGADAEADTKPGEGLIDITLTTTTPLDLTRDVATTAGEDETNFVEGIGLGDFAEYHITAGADADAKARAIVFTDKEQAAPPIAPEIVTFQNLSPVASRLRNFVATTSGTTYDHDDDPRTAPIAVGVTCLPLGTTCTVTETADGTRVTSISGYKISTEGTGVTIAAATGQTLNESEDTTYLAFGAWVAQTEDVDGADGDITFGAFANGSGTTNQATSGAAITGTAKYNGSAAGVHNTPDGTNFFHADATLTADFGDATAQGTITGRISGIKSGGNAVSGTIYLDRAEDATNDQNIVAAGTFNGRARMGAGVTNPQTGEVTYPYEGAWDGRFYNNAPAVPANQPPLSAAGTFGVQNTDHMGTADDMSDDVTSSFIGAFGAHKDE